jgi:hypothetical protein
MTFRRLCTLAALGMLLASSGCCWHHCCHRPILPWRRCCEPACGSCSACCAAPVAVDCGCSAAPPLAGPVPGPVVPPPHAIAPPSVETIAPMPKAANGLH